MNLLIFILYVRVLIYSGPGSWEDGVYALMNFFKEYDIPVDTGSQYLFNSPDSLKKYSLIVIPGGWAEDYENYIDRECIVNYVNDGGGYLGICAGSYFMTRNVSWNDTIYIKDGEVLFEGWAVGPISEIASWPLYTMTEIETTHGENKILYYGGPYYASEYIESVSGVYHINGKPAVIRFRKGKGKVVFCGVHPEIEEDSDRDGTDFAEDFDDDGSDWEYLYHEVEYLLYSQSVEESNKERSYITGEDYILYDITGRKVILPSSTPGVYFMLKKAENSHPYLKKIIIF